jgi:hypothetical protein
MQVEKKKIDQKNIHQKMKKNYIVACHVINCYVVFFFSSVDLTEPIYIYGKINVL